MKTKETCRFENRSSCRDDVKDGLPTGNERSVAAGVERGETPSVFHGKRQKEMVGEMLGPGQLGVEPVIRQGQVIRPELMSRGGYQARKHAARLHRGIQN